MSSDRSVAVALDGRSDVAIRVRDVSKHYVMFGRPEDRFKQMVVPRLERLIGRPPRRYFRDFAALSGVSFEVGRGETVGIIGRNGSGKSTLLQIICGTLQPTSGSVEVNGRIAALLELGAGFNPEFTGRENVFLNASILGVPRKEMEWRFDDIARFADIGPFIDQPVKTYSSGMYVRLAFATAINVDPDILVVDEALAVGDEAFQRKCFARIEDIKDKGGTILFVSHGASTIVQLCTRAMLIDGGEKIFEGMPKAVVSQYQRLANASSAGATEIRAAILQMNDDFGPVGGLLRSDVDGAPLAESTKSNIERWSDLSMAAPQVSEHEASVTQDGPDKDGLADYFDANLVSKSTVVLEERGAKIRDVRITTLHGHVANVLRLGKRYIFQYSVEFDVDATNVGFGMWIRTVDGLGLAGVQSINSPSQRTPKVAKGETISVAIEFSCLTLPGTYFFTCGVFGTVGAEQIVMHRIIDALMSRTAPEADIVAIGRIDLGARLSLACEKKSQAASNLPDL
ncbi:ABC transporter ATP-binding protein [Mesorhizobium humile]|uniref:ABC transporter ATP-binding protein n=1 Tax=Mesorhizobium humile TaxID=3072313 RepID=A0ABU4YDH0_9HYPH|nr:MULTISPECIES: ABC transporter ATP-binding protein [unclassified Mesorhizobium]MDX8459210.1 ABC transporter ATP-binding protein [Mesorhizobium sp. VK2D]MDX8484993.1 ABC transporter ATP-binding protein [Mesorhizobium sp. VK2B]